jgi:hypothetical protein
MTQTEKDQRTAPIEAIIAFLLLKTTLAHSSLTPTKKEEAACIRW